MKDQLYLLRPGFFNGSRGPFYCPDSASVEGLLGFFPKLRERVEVHYLEFSRPRNPLVETLGESHQSLPVLIVAAHPLPNCAGLQLRNSNGRNFIDDECQIRLYLSSQYEFPQATELHPRRGGQP
jgi:hypothetical protein